MFTQLPTDPGVPYGLRVDGRRSPALGVDSSRPRLSWRLPIDAGGATATVVEVARGEGHRWSSAELVFTTILPLDAAAFDLDVPLESRQTIRWRVGLKGAGVPAVAWSEPASFEVALAEDDWQAAWISSAEWSEPPAGYSGPPPVLGTDFRVAAAVRRARLHLSAAGTIEARLNGRPIGDEVLGFGYSVERVRLPARAFDVTEIVTEGRNALRVTVGGGISWVPPIADRYTKLTTEALPPRLRARLEIECEDGTALTVATGEQWFTIDGPVRMSHWYGGEDIDGRMPEPDSPIDEAWEPCTVLDAAHPSWWLRRPPLRIVDRLRGSVVSRTADAVLVDFGTNVAGWPVLTLSGCVGDEHIRIRPAEILLDGTVDQRTTGTPIWDSYTARPGDQTWHPRHVYHGFRYVEVSGLGAAHVTAEAAVIRADNESVGSYAVDDPFLDTLHTIIDRAVQGNMYSVFTDCPNREKLGWIEQLHLCFGLLTRLYDVEAHLADTLQLMRDAQRGTGLVPSTVPETTDFSGIEFGGDPTAFVDDVNWGGAMAHLALLHHREYGDRRVLADALPAVLRLLDHLRSRSERGLLDFGLGDWVALDESTPRAMVATYGWIQLLRAAASISLALDDAGAHAGLIREADVVSSAFVGAFGAEEGAEWGSGSQASYALALDADVVPAERRDLVTGRLVRAIESSGGRLTVGENTWPALIRVLHRAGRDDLIDGMVRSPDGPGYGRQIALGATALAETWLGADGARFENSQNHFMLGMVHDWMARDIAGLAQARGSVAWGSAFIAPHPLHAAQTEVRQETTRGVFSVQMSASPPTLTVGVPAGATGRVVLPPGWAAPSARVHELASGRWVWTR